MASSFLFLVLTTMNVSRAVLSQIALSSTTDLTLWPPRPPRIAPPKVPRPGKIASPIRAPPPAPINVFADELGFFFSCLW